MDKLVLAETLDGGQLRQAATLKTDQSILLQIEGKDCVALEVRYHKQCYQQYTSDIRHRKGDTATATSSTCRHLYQKSFDTFCEQFVQTNILQDECIYCTNKVKEKFVKTVATVENEDASNYSTARLKKRMQTRFPQLVFQANQRRNESEIVYSNAIKPSTVVAAVGTMDTSQTSSTDAEDDDKFGSVKSNKANHSSASLRELYDVALTLQMELAKTKDVR